MDEPPRSPRIWVRVVEAHATRTWVAVILATSVSVSVVLLVIGAVVNTILNPANHDLSENFTTVIAGTLGVAIGQLASYVGNPPGQQEYKLPPRDDDLTLDVEEPDGDAHR